MDDSPYQEALHRSARAGHYVMVIMVFLQWVHPTIELVGMSPVSHDQQLLENVYKDVLYPLPETVVHFAFEKGVCNILAKTRYSPVLAHAAVLLA